jgi:hypothetical protein
MQGQAQKQAAEAQEAQYRAQAEMQGRQAVLEQTAGQYQQRRAMERLDGLSATQRAIMAGSGFSITGSPIDVLTDSRREGMLDVAAIKFSTDLKSQNLNYGAAISGMNAAAAGRAGDMAMTTGMLSGLTGAMSVFTPGKASSAPTVAPGAITPLIGQPNPRSATMLGGLF